MPENDTKQITDIPFSVLDLSPIADGSTPADSFRNTLELARLAEKLGYNRYWLAEHHNMPFIASSATSVVISHVAADIKNPGRFRRHYAAESCTSCYC